MHWINTGARGKKGKEGKARVRKEMPS